MTPVAETVPFWQSYHSVKVFWRTSILVLQMWNSSRLVWWNCFCKICYWFQFFNSFFLRLWCTWCMRVILATDGRPKPELPLVVLSKSTNRFVQFLYPMYLYLTKQYIVWSCTLRKLPWVSSAWRTLNNLRTWWFVWDIQSQCAASSAHIYIFDKHVVMLCDKTWPTIICK